MKALIAVSVVALASMLSGCIINPVNVERANITIHADKVATANPQ